MSDFYRIETDAETGTAHITVARRVHAPGYTLDADNPPQTPPDGWSLHATPAAFLASPELAEARPALERMQLLESGYEPPELDPHFGLPVPDDDLPWAQPQGVLGAYPVDARVTHAGKTWTSNVEWNIWEPADGSPFWRPDQTDDGPAPWVQPQGTVGMYAKGDVVSHNGATWISDYDNNVWEPGVFGWTRQP